MKTISEFRDTQMVTNEEVMDKTAANLSALSIPAMALIPTAAAAVSGKIYSDVTAPPAGKHNTFQTELLKKELQDVLIDKEKRDRLKKLKEVLNGSKRSLRL